MRVQDFSVETSRVHCGQYIACGGSSFCFLYIDDFVRIYTCIVHTKPLAMKSFDYTIHMNYLYMVNINLPFSLRH